MRMIYFLWCCFHGERRNRCGLTLKVRKCLLLRLLYFEAAASSTISFFIVLTSDEAKWFLNIEIEIFTRWVPHNAFGRDIWVIYCVRDDVSSDDVIKPPAILMHLKEMAARRRHYLYATAGPAYVYAMPSRIVTTWCKWSIWSARTAMSPQALENGRFIAIDDTMRDGDIQGRISTIAVAKSVSTVASDDCLASDKISWKRICGRGWGDSIRRHLNGGHRWNAALIK